MRHPIRISAPRARLWGRLSLAVAAAGAFTLAGLPGIDQPEAEAAPKAGVRCDELYLGRQYPTTPVGSGVPVQSPYGSAPNDENYTFDNPDKAFDGLQPPTDAQLKRAGKSRKKIDQWKNAYKASGDPADRAMEIYARYNAQQKKANGYADFNEYLRIRIIGNTGNRVKGNTFEGRMVKKFNLVGPDWWCQDPIAYKDPNSSDPAKTRYRIMDAHNRRMGKFVEIKSNGKIENPQYAADRLIAQQPKYSKHTFDVITGAKTEQSTIDKYKALNKELQTARGTGRNQAGIWEQRSNSIERTGKPNVYTNFDKRFNADPAKGGRGPIVDQALRSGKTPEEAWKLQKKYDNNNRGGYFGRGPGGIDFSSLELNYVGAPVKGKGLDYSMKADYVPDPDTAPGWGGDAKLSMASDSFFTWLALTPDKFWVNLNPDQPQTIMDDAFASTDAGRVLLEADLQLKHDFFLAMDPRTDVGKQAWDGLAKRNGFPCLNSGRNWIEPRPAKVREQDGGIYILDAPLKLQTEAMTINSPSPGESCDLTKAEIESNEGVLRRTVVPLVEKWINTGPAYADLRRVYTSRVAAEWIRRQDAQKPTDYRRIINSNDVKRWPIRAPHQDWKKTDVFDKYRKIFTEGEFKYEISNGHDVYVYSVGGVDFSKAPKHNITHARFNAEHKGLDRTTRTSVRSEVTYQDGSTAYLGGSTADQPASPDNPAPTPEPTPSGKPTDKPTTPATHTPAPGTSSPAGGGASRPSTGDEGDGDLAHTGSDTPFGLLSGIAVSLAAAGAGLVWWMRRKKGAHG